MLELVALLIVMRSVSSASSITSCVVTREIVFWVCPTAIVAVSAVSAV